MPFPTSDDVQDFGKFLRYNSLHHCILDKRPELAGRLQTHNAPSPFIAVSIDAVRNVGISELRMRSKVGSWPVWFIIDPSTTLRPRLWSVLTDPDVLADAFLERVDTWLERRPEASPWRWDEPSISTIVALADLLADCGFAPSHVVANNRMRGVYQDGDYHLVVTEHGESRDFLTIGVPDGELRVYRSPTFGWLADRRSGDRWHRVDLGRLLTDQPSAVPGVAETAVSVDRLAEALIIELTAEAEPPAPKLEDDPAPQAPAPACSVLERTVRELHGFGFGDIVATDPGSEGRLASGTLHVVQWSRETAVPIGAVKQNFADAVVRSRSLLFVSDTGLTKPARKFADAAGVFVFNRDSTDGAVWPGGLTQQLRFGSILEE